MNFQKIGACSMFSSDFKENCLIHTETDGSIHFQNTRIQGVNPIKKHVKFYPPDTFVFTTTSVNGLQVYDRMEGKMLYSYSKESLLDHCYSKNCILSSFDEFNIKFYDLRTRYLINTIQQPNIKKLEWQGDFIYCLTDNGLNAIDYKSGGALIHSISNVTDFCICNDKCYYLTKELKNKQNFENVLSEICIKDDKTLEMIKKNVSYCTVQSVFNKSVLVGLMEGGFKIERNEKVEYVKFGEIMPTKVHLSREGGYIFTKDALYSVEGDLSDL